MLAEGQCEDPQSDEILPEHLILPEHSSSGSKWVHFPHWHLVFCFDVPAP